MSHPIRSYLTVIIACLVAGTAVADPVPGPEPVPVPPGPASQPTVATPTSQPTATASPATQVAPSVEAPRPAAKGPAPKPVRTAPAKNAPLPPSLNPHRELQSSDAIRRAVRGTPSAAPVRPSEELTELRKFEESAFPRQAPDVLADEAAPPRPARPSAENPPPELRSHPEQPTRPAAPVAKQPPEPWLAKLALPSLPVRWDQRVIRYLEFYRDNAKGRAIMSAWLKRMGRYRTMIARVLRKHGLPDDLIFVAMIESGFNPAMTSRVGAGGIWQFMMGTARGYGLHRDHWIDERRNPLLSTEAAARYLKDLHARFGSWELALAAYNAGYGAVQRSVRKYNTNDYWQLCRYESGLPWSTSLYVPKVLATAIVSHNRGYFGYADVKPEPELGHELVSVPTSITTAQAARAAGVETALIELLNPELRRGRTPPSSKAWIRVPRGTEKSFYASLARLKGQLAKNRPYIVRLGDTVQTLADEHGISRAALQRLNGLRRDEGIRPGLIILVPARPVAKAPARASTDEEERLLVAVPDGTPSKLPGTTRVFYRAVAGDSLRRVARHLQVEETSLASWNKLDPTARLLPDMVLQAFVAPTFDQSSVRLLDRDKIVVMVAGSESFLNTYEQRQGRKRLYYIARKGDTLASVGRRFGLSVGSLARINRFARTTQLSEGQRIVVYVDPAKLKRKLKRRRKRRRPRQVARRETADAAPAPANRPRKKRRRRRAAPLPAATTAKPAR